MLFRKMKPSGTAFLLMKKLKLLKVKFIPEFLVGNKHVDVFIPKSKIAIEIDGDQHVTSAKQILSDFKREEASLKRGISTIHISNKEIIKNPGGVASAIAEASDIKSGSNL